MKNFKLLTLLSISLSILVIACNKKTTGTTGTTKPTLILSKSVVKIGEPLVVTTKGQAQGSTINWSASPNASIWTSASGDSATFLFTSPGNYQVTASYLSAVNAPAYDSSNSSLTVSDSLYADSSVVHCDAVINAPISSGDQISLTPISFSDSAGLVLLANTKDIYNYIPSLNYTGNLSGAGGTYECDFNSVVEYPCSYSLPTPATGDVFFSSLSNGTYDLVFKLNNTTYQGSLTVTSTACTFTWNYNSGVTIYPLQIQKTM